LQSSHHESSLEPWANFLDCCGHQHTPPIHKTNMNPCPNCMHLCDLKNIHTWAIEKNLENNYIYMLLHTSIHNFKIQQIQTKAFQLPSTCVNPCLAFSYSSRNFQMQHWWNNLIHGMGYLFYLFFKLLLIERSHHPWNKKGEHICRTNIHPP
jgi:hypothetical protein